MFSTIFTFHKSLDHDGVVQSCISTIYHYCFYSSLKIYSSIFWLLLQLIQFFLSFNKYLLGSYNVLATLLGAAIQRNRQNIKQIKYWVWDTNKFSGENSNRKWNITCQSESQILLQISWSKKASPRGWLKRRGSRHTRIMGGAL